MTNWNSDLKLGPVEKSHGHQNDFSSSKRHHECVSQVLDNQSSSFGDISLKNHKCQPWRKIKESLKSLGLFLVGILRVYIKFKCNISIFLLRCFYLYHSGGLTTDTIIIHRATSPVLLKNLDYIVTAVISLSWNTDPWFSTHSLNVCFDHTRIPEAPTQCSTFSLFSWHCIHVSVA